MLVWGICNMYGSILVHVHVYWYIRGACMNCTDYVIHRSASGIFKGEEHAVRCGEKGQLYCIL